MSDLDNLRPEVREAIFEIECRHNVRGWKTVRAELLRLARGNDEWQARCLQFQRERDKAQAELAALKARIADAPEAYLTSRTGIGPCNIASLAHGAVFDSSSYGKSVRLVVED